MGDFFGWLFCIYAFIYIFVYFPAINKFDAKCIVNKGTTIETFGGYVCVKNIEEIKIDIKP